MEGNMNIKKKSLVSVVCFFCDILYYISEKLSLTMNIKSYRLLADHLNYHPKPINFHHSSRLY